MNALDDPLEDANDMLVQLRQQTFARAVEALDRALSGVRNPLTGTTAATIDVLNRTLAKHGLVVGRPA